MEDPVDWTQPPTSHSAGTIVAKNYIAQARVLAESFMEHHPNVKFHTLVIDADEADRELEGLGNVVLLSDLQMSDSDLAQVKLVYTVMELSTAVKPMFLQLMLRAGAQTATYIDPDIRFFQPIDDVFDTAWRVGAVLTPHLITPYPDDDLMISHSAVMHSGIYNLGFGSFGPAATRFLAWWRKRLLLEGFVDFDRAQFTDQRWVDWAPSFVPVHVSKDQGLNAAYWNLHERPISQTADGEWRAGQMPLRFFHFSGFDPTRPWLLSKHQGSAPRILLSEQDDLRRLTDDYKSRLELSGHVELRKRPYGHDVTPSGLRLTREVRWAARAAFEGEDPLGQEPPDPWALPDEFESWLTERVLGPSDAQFSRLEYALLGLRGDLRAMFPDALGGSARGFRLWLDVDPEGASVEESIRPSRKAPSARPKSQRRQESHRALSFGGWSVIGYASAELGVGEASRRISAAVQRTGLPWDMVGLTRNMLSRQSHRADVPVHSSPAYANQILCVNADAAPAVAASLGPLPRGARRIGLWFWELEEFPEHFRGAFGVVDEVWVASDFCREAIRRHTDLPVRVMPLPATPSDGPPKFSREQLGLPLAEATFVTTFDYLSVPKRKNPLGVIEAYCEAFAESDGATLIVKSINGHHRAEDRELVRLATRGRADVVLMDQYLDAARVSALLGHATALVSLHRAEGYGLNLVDAMAQGVPTIATGYSGNLAFQDANNAFLVPWKRVSVGLGAEPYSPSATWAEPDIGAASAAMREVVDRPARARDVSEAGRATVESLSAANVAGIYLKALAPELGTGMES